jgi:hypothetical protein
MPFGGHGRNGKAMHDMIPWVERGVVCVVLVLLWLRTANVHVRMARIERALAPGVKHEVRHG